MYKSSAFDLLLLNCEIPLAYAGNVGLKIIVKKNLAKYVCIEG